MSYKAVERGTVKYFNFTKKFGFIIPESGEDDIFVHYSDICGEYPNKRLFKGDSVEFSTVDDERGKKKAIEVKKIKAANADHHDQQPDFADDDSQAAFLHAQPQPADDHDSIMNYLKTDGNNSEVSTFITIKYKRFKSISEKTNRNFMGQIEVIYEPKDRILDVSSVETYLAAYAKLNTSYQEAVSLIYQHIKTELNPLALEITGTFSENKSVETVITAGNIHS